MCLQVGGKAPDFKGQAVMPDSSFKEISLSDYKGKWLVLFFYPLDFTFVCPTEIIAFSDRVKDFKSAGAEIVGCSIDSHYTHLAWRNTPRKDGGLGQIDYPLLSDLSKSISAGYGVLLEKPNVAARGVFIIDDEGVVQSVTVNNLGVGRNINEMLRVVKAFQTVKKTGEVCPANWTEGAKTMVPDPQKSKKYFSGGA